MQTITVDALICGGGMSGLACASFAASSGAKVLVVEKQSTVGGSSNYSAGMFWGPKSYSSLRSWVPWGNPDLQAAWMQDYLPAVQWMRENGVPVAQRFDGIMTIGIGFPINIPHLHAYHQQRIRDSNTGSQIFTNTAVVKLLQEVPGVPGSRVIGAVIRRADGTHYEVRAKRVVLATGGFQGNPRLLSMHMGQHADDMFVRSNKGSVGDGLILGTQVGAGSSRGMSTFYGHLLAAPLQAEKVDPRDYLPLAQYQSKHCLLINENGRRFADETTGDEIINQYLAKQEKRRGFLLFNDRTRTQHCISAPFPNAGEIDRLAKAQEHGCRVGSAPSINGLVDILKEWGVNETQARRTIEQYDQVIRLGNSTVALDAPVGAGGKPPVPLVEGDGPFFCMEVQPSITFTYGGIRTDPRGRALTTDGNPIPGLLVAGVDGGGFSNLGYAGGLALAFVTGFWAAKAIAIELNLPVPSLPAADQRDAVDRDFGMGSKL
ncbi:3-ketosteroid 1-dehydrogenase helE [Aspergillus vadensis CBS 113365]|uniref:Extracellular 3-ketosteroid 1-dehydrogenase n=1 Tax=Aspergillus vadensis (strain CBS 113365 / IMI 142717 / IBT 24658) TaxID=1448311 RepID=A0A319B0G1_ASPVC|nr:extracellular 3-ketosteroid 1-dehydrogenase [Aspergillus vadensis CBS 113365]PYH63640.1 extracellular 3-ketosteroid 1-dehydrogenase [Aspergillus vadensis CBS 113365]